MNTTQRDVKKIEGERCKWKRYVQGRNRKKEVKVFTINENAKKNSFFLILL